MPAYDVMKASGSAAASRMDRLEGLSASSLESTAAYYASDPWMPPTPPVIPYTSSPALNAVTPGPAVTTTPARSMPSTSGKGMPRMRGGAGANLEVERIQAARDDTHQHLARRWRGTRQGSEFERAVMSIQNQRLHGHDRFRCGEVGRSS
jgi:hypothetical protein